MTTDKDTVGLPPSWERVSETKLRRYETAPGQPNKRSVFVSKISEGGRYNYRVIMRGLGTENIVDRTDTKDEAIKAMLDYAWKCK